MIQFILTTVLMASLGTMLYLVARLLPRVEEGEVSGKPGFLDKLSSSEIPEKLDAAFNNFMTKSLRKTKVVLLKIENFVNDKLKKVSANGNGNGGLTGRATAKPKIDFKDLSEESSLSEEEVEKTPGSDNN